MRVLHIGKYYSPFNGGIENFMAVLLPHLAHLDYELLCLAHNHNAMEKMREEIVGGIRVVRSMILGKLLFTPIAPFFPVDLARIVREFKPDIIHVHMPNVSAFWVLLLPACRRVPLVIHWHSDVIVSKLNRLLKIAYVFYRPFESWLLNRSAYTIATSPSYVESSLPLQKIREKVQIIPLGLVDRTKYNIIENQKFFKVHSALKVLSIGRLTYYKGHEVLIRAVSEMRNCELKIVGTGELQKKLEVVLNRNSFDPDEVLLGSVSADELSQLLSECDCFCLPSTERTEAFGNVLLEAMRAGKAVIASNVTGSGMTWVVEDGVTGLLFEPNDHIDLQSKLQRLQTDRLLMNQLGVAGYKRFKSMFLIDAVAKEVSEIYKDLMN